jgi:hypothetical protein
VKHGPADWVAPANAALDVTGCRGHGKLGHEPPRGAFDGKSESRENLLIIVMINLAETRFGPIQHRRRMGMSCQRKGLRWTASSGGALRQVVRKVWASQ